MDQPQPVPPVTDPFPGPRPFTRSESAIFKGRTRESRDLRDLVMSYQVVVLHSRSGSGKTSLVNAGLLPLLVEEGFESCLIARVGGEPPAGIAVLQIGNIYTFNALSSALGSGFHAHDGLRTTLTDAVAANPDGSPRLLILDQFEELFTNHLERWTERKPFLEQVANLCKADPDLRLLLVIRDDFLAELDTYADMLPYSLRIRYRLERLREDSALKGVVEPLAMAGYSFEPGVAEELVANLTRMKVQTPSGVQEVIGEYIEPVHLQVVCQNLWNNRPSNRKSFTREDVLKFADVSQSLRSYYDRVIQSSAKASRVRERNLRRWFDRELITAEGTRGLVHMGLRFTGTLPNRSVEALEREHVIRAEPRAGGRWYEITHDRFIGPIRDSNRVWFARRRRRILLATVVPTLAVLILISVRAVLADREEHARQATIGKQLAQAQTEMRQGLTAEQLSQQGTPAERSKQLQQALTHYRKALSLYASITDAVDPATKGDVETRTGAVLYSLADLNGSVQEFGKAYQLHSAAKAWTAAARDQESIGDGEELQGNPLKAIAALENAWSLLKKTGQTNGWDAAYTLNGLGWCYIKLSRYQDALDQFLNAVKIADAQYEQLSASPSTRTPGAVSESSGNPWVEIVIQQANANAGIGAVYTYRGTHQYGLANFQKAFDQVSKLADPVPIGDAESDLGFAYMQLGKYQTALNLFKDAYQKATSGATAQEALCNQSAVYLLQRNYPESVNTANQCIEIARGLGDQDWTGTALWLQTLDSLGLGKLDQAQQHANEALNILQKVGDKEMQARTLNALGLIAEARHDQEQAASYMQEAVNLNKEIGCRTIFAQQAERDLDSLRRVQKDDH